MPEFDQSRQHVHGDQYNAENINLHGAGSGIRCPGCGAVPLRAAPVVWAEDSGLAGLASRPAEPEEPSPPQIPDAKVKGSVASEKAGVAAAGCVGGVLLACGLICTVGGISGESGATAVFGIVFSLMIGFGCFVYPRISLGEARAKETLELARLQEEYEAALARHSAEVDEHRVAVKLWQQSWLCAACGELWHESELPRR